MASACPPGASRQRPLVCPPTAPGCPLTARQPRLALPGRSVAPHSPRTLCGRVVVGVARPRLKRHSMGWGRARWIGNLGQGFFHLLDFRIGLAWIILYLYRSGPISKKRGPANLSPSYMYIYD
jgi:hypothetical protein